MSSALKATPAQVPAMLKWLAWASGYSITTSHHPSISSVSRWHLPPAENAACRHTQVAVIMAERRHLCRRPRPPAWSQPPVTTAVTIRRALPCRGCPPPCANDAACVWRWGAFCVRACVPCTGSVVAPPQQPCIGTRPRLQGGFPAR